jgi:hypothetical protein
MSEKLLLKVGQCQLTESASLKAFHAYWMTEPHGRPILQLCLARHNTTTIENRLKAVAGKHCFSVAHRAGRLIFLNSRLKADLETERTQWR